MALAFSWSSAVEASETFPAELVSAVPMKGCTPGCVVCHRDNNGGPGTAIKPFVGVMSSKGLIATKPETVKGAVEGVRAAMSDLDGDSVGDIAELAKGQDPNFPGNASVCLPTYGCGARVAASPPAAGAGLATLLGATFAIRLARRRRG